MQFSDSFGKLGLFKKAHSYSEGQLYNYSTVIYDERGKEIFVIAEIDYTPGYYDRGEREVGIEPEEVSSEYDLEGVYESVNGVKGRPFDWEGRRMNEDHFEAQKIDIKESFLSDYGS